MSNIEWMSATELLDGYRRGDLSPVEVVDHLLDRIDRHDPAVNAWCFLDPERTRADAAASAERWAAGEPIGRLDGVPVGIKDVFLTEGWPTRKGSATVDPAGPWPDDSPCVSALRRNGAVLLGKTTTPELGWKGVTDAPATGTTRNPWAVELTPGGSSGGSSAALAAGMVPLALGTDGGGSIRIPAAFAGVAGIKPTWGRVPHWPVSPYGGLAHAGPMARTIADTALLLDVLAEPDHRDPAALLPDGIGHLAACGGGIAGVRVAFSADLGFVDVDPEVAALVTDAAATFTDLGAHVDAADPGFDDPVDTFSVLWNSGAAQATSADTPDQHRLRDPGLREICADGRRYSAVDYIDALNRRGALAVSMGEFHQRHDLLVTPAVPIAAFRAGVEVPDGWPHPRWMSWTPFSYPFNLTQQPAVSVPCGFTSAGLPVGLQIIGPRGADALVLRAAHAYETARPFHLRHPDLG
ncbi:amidase [Rhabdothermincola salaria]|uniref:amidase n=1 Tax=Rhabdothermincola salaria TaxID=2903142 RepID=UPI001E2F0FBE|nr:amidase [Rhabdothermincola salaria]